MAFFGKSLALAALLALCGPVAAQEAKIAFGGLAQDTSLPVEVQADMLSVNNADGTAIFEGNVLVGQGEMRLAAAKVAVEYDKDGKSIVPPSRKPHVPVNVSVLNYKYPDPAQWRVGLVTEVKDGSC